MSVTPPAPPANEPPGTGELVRTRPTEVSSRLLAPPTTTATPSGGESASDGVSHTNPARDAMLKKLLS
ncbi:MAG TPA: hypothetical protein PLW10_00555 [Myxococcota bacterium]|nr:hypothetical protein [Myxococcota bacterium]HPG24095.1 hypothetical protein [Myxococcota bacterium]